MPNHLLFCKLMNSNPEEMPTENRIIPGLQATDRSEVIDELLNKLVETGGIRVLILPVVKSSALIL